VTTSRRLSAFGGAALVAGLALTGLAATTAPPRADAPEVGQVEPGPVVEPARPPGPAPSSPALRPAAPSPPARPSGIDVTHPGAPPPVRLELGFAGRRALVVPAGVLRDGSFDVPDDPRTVGWWAAGSAPGDPAGTVMLAGHLDSADRGLGVFTVLLSARVGDRISVRDAAGRDHAYRITGRRSYPRGRLPAGLFRRSGPPRLLLLTCGGGYDARHRHYNDTVVVAAEPL
jgi:hypothetical protein